MLINNNVKIILIEIFRITLYVVIYISCLSIGGIFQLDFILKCAVLLFMLSFLYIILKLLNNNGEELQTKVKKPEIVYSLGYKIIEMNTYRDCLIDDERLILYTANSRMFDFNWSDFTSYSIKNKTLILLKSYEQQMIVIEQSKIGKTHFTAIFVEVLERLKRIDINN